MSSILLKVLGFVVSGLVFRLLASVGLSLFSIGFINGVVNDYINRALQGFSVSLPPLVLNLLGVAKADVVISIWINALIFVSTYKSIKFIFIRK